MRQLGNQTWFALFLGWALALGMAGASAQTPRVRIEGQNFDGLARVGEVDLKLNGVGLRAVAWFKAYAAALYLPQKAATAAQVLGSLGPKRLQMRMLQDVPTTEFIKAFDKGLARNTPIGELPGLKERMARFDQQIGAVGQVKKGDVIDLDFVPGKGLVLSVNGKVRGEAIPGEDLYAGLLRIFIGDKPTDDKLKAALLGAQWS